MEEKLKFPRDYDGSCYGIDLNSSTVQKMAETGPTHDVLQETVYGWLEGVTVFWISDKNHLTYADFVEHIGCDAQEYSFRSLGSKRSYTWIASDNPLAKFGAFFCENDNGEWTIYATGSSQINTPDWYVDRFKK